MVKASKTSQMASAGEWDIAAGKTAWIAPAIVFFVVVESDFRSDTKDFRGRFGEDAVADLAMALHDLKFFRGQFPWFEQNGV